MSLALASCANVSEVETGIDPRELWARQSACVVAWETLLDDWEQNGGGILASLSQMRVQIESDRISNFARLVRNAWASQKVARDKSQLGALPISDEQYRHATSAVYESAGEFMVDDCRVPIYLDNWWNRRIMDRRLVDMPVTVADDPWPKRLWLQYWIFVRLE